MFALEGSLYGLRLWSVDRVVPAAMITPLPKAPAIVMGIIRIGGMIVPVVNLRRRFHLPERDLMLTDQLIVARAPRRGKEGYRTLALVVDSVEGVRELPGGAMTPAPRILAGLEYLEGVARTDDGMILIHDLGTFLSLEEDDALGAALDGGPA
ncbi:MAG TPA: chemotaxis protein CheW [Spirochaetia bacterium]